ncbi:leucine-rich repeat domain-containing protein, partial [Acinetobacter baumannii]|uniref:leucine-rich repeat domain-containing protein n=1 Tax=Acinetobacter baumannii TaxID=470 RepID=UPI003CFC081A
MYCWDGSVRGLQPTLNGLKGEIPSALSNLSNLEWLDLTGNEITGRIPTELTALGHLTKLNLSSNQLEGS